MKHDDCENIEFRHKMPVQIRFNDIDMFGHLNNNVYLQFFDLGKYAYFRQFMNDTFGSEPTVPVVANINVNFHQPAHIDDTLTVSTAVTEIGESSIVMRQQITDENGELKCSARIVMVNINTQTGASTPVSDAWRSCLSEYESKKL